MSTTVLLSFVMFVGLFAFEAVDAREYVATDRRTLTTETPVVLSIWPTSGPMWGSTEVTVDGQLFTPTYNLTCKFGSHASVHTTYVTSTRLRCLSPVESNSVTALQVPLEISNNDQDYTGSNVPFEYQRT